MLGSLRTGLVAIHADASMRLAALSDGAAAVLDCTTPAAKALGRPAGEVLGHQTELLALLRSALDGRERPGRCELRLPPRRGGEPFTIGYTLIPVVGPAGDTRGAAILFRDLTLFERREEQDRHKDRLLALGQMAAGLAHELRNPLASLEVLLGLLKRRAAGEADGELIEEALGEVRSLAATVTGSLDFVRPLQLERRATPARELLDDALMRASARVAFDGPVEVHVSPELDALDVDPERMRAALVDLVANALEAMQGDGDERPSPAAAPSLRLSAEPSSDGGVRIEVADRGPGVEASLRERIFHPFFTTRAEGTGVGLAEVQKVVAAHGGQVEVDDRPGGGAVFRMHLPAAGACDRADSVPTTALDDTGMEWA
ncbi:MAG: ATP-binding protein [Myxococcota bacterium]|nr:ATP-binding protein [Myxococcota bacterium]